MDMFTSYGHIKVPELNIITDCLMILVRFFGFD